MRPCSFGSCGKKSSDRSLLSTWPASLSGSIQILYADLITYLYRFVGNHLLVYLSRFQGYALSRKRQAARDRIELLSKSERLRHLPPEQIEPLIERVAERESKAGEVLFRVGEPVDPRLSGNRRKTQWIRGIVAKTHLGHVAWGHSRSGSVRCHASQGRLLHV